MIARFAEVREFAKDRLAEAKVRTEAICFALEESEKLGTKMHQPAWNIRASAIGDEPTYAELDTTYGTGAWAVLLSVDLRGSSRRAVKIGAKATYLTMHTYIPTMAELVGKADGRIVGLRGDGLFAAFGLTQQSEPEVRVSPTVASEAVRTATHCGKAMLEATEEILTPLLASEGIPDELAIGVGISAGDIVVTRIGWLTANELTTYGPPVNQACKFSNKGTVIRLSTGAHQLYPRSKGGKVNFRVWDGSHVADFPDDMHMLGRSTKQSSAARSRPR